MYHARDKTKKHFILFYLQIPSMLDIKWRGILDVPVRCLHGLRWGTFFVIQVKTSRGISIIFAIHFIFFCPLTLLYVSCVDEIVILAAVSSITTNEKPPPNVGLVIHPPDVLHFQWAFYLVFFARFCLLIAADSQKTFFF